MKRFAIVIVAGALLVGVFGQPASARGPKWQFAQADPITLPSDVCGFPVLVEPVRNEEYPTTTANADGSLTIRLIRVSCGWPLFLTCVAGIVIACANPGLRRRAIWLLIPAVSYYVFALNVILYN